MGIQIGNREFIPCILVHIEIFYDFEIILKLPHVHKVNFYLIKRNTTCVYSNIKN